MRASCSICTENFTSDSEISAVPCGHTFHDECLRKWIVQSKTCPQCRKIVQVKSVIHKLFFNEGDVEDVDIGKLTNEVDNLKFYIKQKDRERAEIEAEQEKLMKRISGLHENVNSVQLLYQKERTQSETLRKELGYFQKMQQEANAAKQEACKLREKLRGLKNVQDLVNGMLSDIEDKAHNSSIQDLAKWVVVQEKELKRKRQDCKKLQDDLLTKNRENSKIKRILDDQTKQYVVLKEKLRISEQDVTSLERQNISLKKKLEALKNSIDSPNSSSIGSSLAHRLINESPAPLPPNKRPRLSEPEYGIDIDLDITSEILSSPPLSSSQTANSQLKSNCKEYGTKLVKITSAASTSRPAKDVRDISNLPGLNNLNILKKTIGTGSMLKQQSSFMKKGYNGLGGHDKFIQPLGHPLAGRKIKKSTSASAIGNVKKSNPFKIPPLPSMDGC